MRKAQYDRHLGAVLLSIRTVAKRQYGALSVVLIVLQKRYSLLLNKFINGTKTKKKKKKKEEEEEE